MVSVAEHMPPRELLRKRWARPLWKGLVLNYKLNEISFIYFATSPSVNVEQVVAQWRCPEAAGVALEMLHRVMCAALHPGLRMAIKIETVHNGGALFPIVVFFLNSFTTIRVRAGTKNSRPVGF